MSLFYEASLRRTGNPVRAQINALRKVLGVLWSIWKNKVSYKPVLFYSPPKSRGIALALENPLDAAVDACGYG